METEFLANNGDEDVDGDGDPDLRFHGIGRSSIKGFDTKMLLDPFEEQFDLPPASVKLSDGQRRLGHVVGQENQSLARIRIDISDSAQGVRVIRLGIEASQHDGLIELQTRRFVHRRGIPSLELEIGLGASYEKGGGSMNAVKSGEVDISAIHDVKRARLEGHIVEDRDIVNLAGRNNDKGRKVSVQRQQGVQLDGRLGLPELGPREERETKIDGGRVQRIGGSRQFRSERLSRVQRGGLTDQDMGKVAENAPIPILVGIGQCASGNVATNAGLVQFLPQSLEAGLDVPQTLPIRQLGKAHDQELAMAPQFPCPLVAAVPCHTFVEFVPRNEFHQLSKDCPPLVHEYPLRMIARGKTCEMATRS